MVERTGFSRRAFLGNVGKGALVMGLSGAVAAEMGIIPDFLDDDGPQLDFGALESMAATMQEMDPDALMGWTAKKLKAGTSLKSLVAAATLANARTFGGQDYTGYHCAMALMPAWHMRRWMPQGQEALPAMKVFHRNTLRIQQSGGRRRERMRQIKARRVKGSLAKELLAAERGRDMSRAVTAMAGGVAADPRHALTAMQPLVRDNIDVHQVVLTWRAWDLLQLTGPDHAGTMLVQAVRQCVDRESNRLAKKRAPQSIRKTLPRAMEEHKLIGRGVWGHRKLTDGELHGLARSIMKSSADGGMNVAATALTEGVAPAVVGEALSIASVWLLLHDPGRARGEKGKPRGSVHGASVGIHASDSANAWRHLAEVVEPEGMAPTLLAGAWHTAGRGRNTERFHFENRREEAKKVDASQLLDAIDGCIRDRDQGLTAALAERYCRLGMDADALFRRLAVHQLEGEGALHHEKFFFTCVEEYGRARPAFKWTYLTALARVAASGYGFEAPGLKEARRVLV